VSNPAAVRRGPAIPVINEVNEAAGAFFRR
jgi:hypothetical protein